MKTFKRILGIALFVLFNSALFAQNEVKSANVIKQRLDSILSVSEKFEFTYDNLGHNTDQIVFVWSNSIMKYEKGHKKEFTYNLQGYCNLALIYSWDKILNQWLIYSKEQRSYDENNQLLLTYSFDWNKTKNIWELISKADYENTYSTNNKLIKVVIYNNNKSATEVYKRKFEYAYNSDGILNTINSFVWFSNAWKIDGTEIFTYDADGNISNISYSTDSYELKYNNNYAINQLLIPLEYFPHWSIIPTDFNVNHMITSSTTTYGTRRYYYSPMEVTGLNDQLTSKATIFPNPATDFLNIQWNGNQSSLNVELIDISGKKVFTGMIENNSKLPIQEYPKGLYLVNISEGKTTKTEKVYFK